MAYFSGPYRIGAIFVMLSAALHLLAFLVGGVNPLTLALTGIGLVYVMIMAGLAAGRRGIAWLAFLVMGFGGSFALAQLWTVNAMPNWWWMLNVAADWLAAAGLFMPLWRNGPQDNQ